MAHVASSAPTSEQPSRRAVLAALPGLLIVMMLAQLDMTIVGTAMPRIVGDLGGVEHLSWVVTAYALAMTVATPLYGKLGDQYGRKRLFVFAIVVFLAGSALSGLAQDMTQLIVFRALQGLGAGGLIVGVMATIGDLVPPRERGRLQGYFAATMGISMIGGPLLGGVLTDQLSWRWTFYINLPLGLVGLALIATTLHLPRHRSEHRIDVLGTTLLAAGASAIVLVTTWGGTQYAWDSVPVIALAATGVAALVAFLLVERRAAEPVLPLRLFRIRNFSVSSALAFLVGFAMFGAITFLPLFMQLVQGASATNSGVLLVPMMVGTIVSSLVAGQVVTRTGRYRALPIAGGGVMAVGLFLLSRMDTGTSELTTGAYMVVLGLGMGLLMQITRLLPQNSVGPRDMGVASSTPTFFQTIGGALGVSLFGAIFNSRLDGSLGGTPQAAGAGAGLDPATMGQLPAAVRDAIAQGVAYASQGVFLVAAGLAALAFLLGWAVRYVPLRSAPEPEPEPDRELVTVD